MLQAGFGRIDITPPLGVSVQGYYEKRLADGILDPLYATAVAFDDGEHKAVVISVDVIGFNYHLMEQIRPMIAEAIGTVKDAVFICCTHTHLAPGITTGDSGIVNEEYVRNMFAPKLRDAAILAVQDLAPAKLSYTRGEAKDVSFIRRFRMKDGSYRTNPGYQNPDIDCPASPSDDSSSLLIIKRENAPEIGIVNFQVHADVIGGCKLSADFPKFVRDTYETLIPGSRCMYINGAEGDSNHVDVRLNPSQCCGKTANGYGRSRYMGRKIAMSVIANYELAEPLAGDKINFGKKSVRAAFNKGTPEELEASRKVAEVYREKGDDAITPFPGRSQKDTRVIALRIVGLADLPDEKELVLTAVSVGDMVFAGFPGEPFTKVGTSVKEASKFTLTMPACCANGYEGYYPTENAFTEGGYEANSARYRRGTAEKLIEESIKLVNSL